MYWKLDENIVSPSQVTSRVQLSGSAVPIRSVLEISDLPSTYLPTYHLQNPTTLNHLLYFFAFGEKVLEMEKISFTWAVVDSTEKIGNEKVIFEIKSAF